jgi:hypothetical protein
MAGIAVLLGLAEASIAAGLVDAESVIAAERLARQRGFPASRSGSDHHIMPCRA